MTEKKGRGAQRSDRPAPAAALKAKRDEFLHSFFKRGAELTGEVVHESRRLRERIAELEADNSALRKQVESDRAMRDLVRKIDQLERERKQLLSTVEEKEAITGQISTRFLEVETELEQFANLYVASFQLHLSLEVGAVLGHLRDLLGQLVGARTAAFYLVDEGRTRLEAIVAEGVEPASLPPIALGESGPADAVAAAVERAFLTGVAHIDPGPKPARPAACVPLRLGEQVAGVLVVYELLPQKRGFVAVDRELFKLLGAHAAGAIAGAYHFARAGRRIPGPADLAGDKLARLR